MQIEQQSPPQPASPVESEPIPHQRLGRDLGIYTSHDLVGAGWPLWLPDGAVIVSELERYILELEQRAGYRRVRTPPVGKRELYERSGHWSHFSEDMFPPMLLGRAREPDDEHGGGDELVMRPVMCPHHALVFGSRLRSHRELPLRIAEFAMQYRYERSGVVGGLLRVRGMTLNDAHVFCAPEQAAAEAAAMLRMIDEAYDVLGIEPAYAMLAVRGPGKSYLGSDQVWERAEALLRDALRLHGLEAKRVEGEAAIYGPKIDIQVYDANGKEFTLSTVQMDLVQPERFGLEYVAPSGERQRPVMVHRSVMSSMERMVAYLLESTGGALPPWLSPVQLQVLPVGPEQGEAAWRFADRARALGLRAEVDDRDDSLGARVRAARAGKAPYIVVLGEREAEVDAVSVRLRSGQQLQPMPSSRFLAAVSEVVSARSRDLALP